MDGFSKKAEYHGLHRITAKTYKVVHNGIHTRYVMGENDEDTDGCRAGVSTVK